VHAQGAPRLSWARLLKRVFDIEHCPNCGGSRNEIDITNIFDALYEIEIFKRQRK
jgi:hypothetical protein